LKACLDVIHIDIVNVWGFEDPFFVSCSPLIKGAENSFSIQLLDSNEFKAMMTHIVDCLSDGDVPSPNKGL